MNFRLSLAGALVLVMAAIDGAGARDFEMGGDPNSYSIMAPEPGTATHHRATASHRTSQDRTPRALKPLAKGSAPRHFYAARGSSGSVLPTPLPRTELIPPEGGRTVTAPPLRQEQGATVVPGLNPVPNLPHGPETFQDRASRCAFQQGLNSVPGTASNQYIHACAM